MLVFMFIFFSRHFWPTKPPFHLTRGLNKTWGGAPLPSVFLENLCVIVWGKSCLSLFVFSFFRSLGIMKRPDFFRVTQENGERTDSWGDILIMLRKVCYVFCAFFTLSIQSSSVALHHNRNTKTCLFNSILIHYNVIINYKILIMCHPVISVHH